MQLSVYDSNGAAVTIIVAGISEPSDKSGALADGTAQELMEANEARSGWMIQNISVNPMYVNDLGATAKAVPTDGDGSIRIAAGETYCSEGKYLTLSAISIIGTALDKFIAREW